jgi:hypothetical protein
VLYLVQPFIVARHPDVTRASSRLIGPSSTRRPTLWLIQQIAAIYPLGKTAQYGYFETPYKWDKPQPVK